MRSLLRFEFAAMQSLTTAFRPFRVLFKRNGVRKVLTYDTDFNIFCHTSSNRLTLAFLKGNIEIDVIKRPKNLVCVYE